MPPSGTSSQHFFSPCPRGLEGPLTEELAAAGAQSIEPVPGGAHFQGDWTTCYRVNLHSRVATRVLWRVAHGPYRSEREAHQLAFDTPWLDYFGPARTIRVYTTGVNCSLRSLDYLTVHLKDAVCARFTQDCGERPSVNTENPDVRIHAFLDEHDVTLYLDTSGEPLFKRRYQRVVSDAPLKENLAAGILLLTGWQGGTPLLDPMCGSGTFLLEAVQMALNIAPGVSRRFAFDRLKWHQPPVWKALRSEAEAMRRRPEPLEIYGSDRNPREVELARRNLAEAGFAEVVRLKRADVLQLQPPAEHGVMVANPPYGVRIGEQRELEAFYPRLGDALKRNFAGWSCYFLSGDPKLPKLIGLGTRRRVPLFNGALECRLLEYEIVQGGMRRRDREGKPAPPGGAEG
jgi:putative N6-adenine-specific DNA methylase